MYFDFEDNRPDTPTIARAISTREAVMITTIIHLLAIILVLVGPSLPFVRAAMERQQQALEEARARELQRERENARFVFVEPLRDVPAPKPPPEDIWERLAEHSPLIRQSLESSQLPPEHWQKIRKELGIEHVKPIGAEQLQALMIIHGADPTSNETSRMLIEARDEEG